jgi:predicted nuclease of predicted toxin-antitoxin system
MTIFVDENIPLTTVEAIRAMGLLVIDPRGTPDEGADDEVLWQRVQEQSALLITTDKGFARRREEEHSGILVVRLRKPNRLKIHAKVLYALSEFAEWQGLTVVMQDTVMRIRRRG